MMSNREKIFEIYATVQDHKSSDGNSLTKELSKVTENGKKSILIRNISRKVNNSWLSRGIEFQASEGLTIERGTNWRDFMWPTGTAKEDDIQKEEKTSEPSRTDILLAVNKTAESIDRNTETINRNTERVKKLEVQVFVIVIVIVIALMCIISRYF